MSKFLTQLENIKAGSVGKELTKWGGADLSRTSKKDKITDDLTRSKIKITDLTRSSNKNKRTDDLINRKKKKKRTCSDGGRTNSLISDVLNEDPFGDLDSMGYSEMDMSGGDLVLVNSFEDTFGDIYGGGVWSELSEIFSSNSQNVVSLSSF
jgi:hypothetical protein